MPCVWLQFRRSKSRCVVGQFFQYLIVSFDLLPVSNSALLQDVVYSFAFPTAASALSLVYRIGRNGPCCQVVCPQLDRSHISRPDHWLGGWSFHWWLAGASSTCWRPKVQLQDIIFSLRVWLGGISCARRSSFTRNEPITSVESDAFSVLELQTTS